MNARRRCSQCGGGISPEHVGKRELCRRCWCRSRGEPYTVRRCDVAGCRGVMVAFGKCNTHYVAMRRAGGAGK